MAFLFTIFSGKKQVPQDVEELRKEFRSKKEEISQALLQNAEIVFLVEMIFDSCEPEVQYFLKSPSELWLKQNRHTISRIISGISSQGVPLFERLVDIVQKHGPGIVSDIILEVLETTSKLLVAKHIAVDCLLESIDYGWQLASPLSRKARIILRDHHQFCSQRTSQQFQSASLFQEHDGRNKIVHFMDEAPPVRALPSDIAKGHIHVYIGKQAGTQDIVDPDKVSGNISAGDTRFQDTIIFEVVGEQERQGSEDGIVASEPGSQSMRVSSPGSNQNEGTGRNPDVENNSEVADEASLSSFGHSRRVSYGGSELCYSLYTTDSDDDSLSTSSHLSLLVAVSEAHETDSSSDEFSLLHYDNDSDSFSRSFQDSDGRTENTSSSDDPSITSFRTEVHDQNGELAVDKLPICSSVVLTRNSENDISQGSFYTPEMWTYSDKDTHDTEDHNHNMQLDEQLEDPCFLMSRDNIEHETNMLEEVKVVVAATVKDKYVSVSVLPKVLEKPLTQDGSPQNSDRSSGLARQVEENRNLETEEHHSSLKTAGGTALETEAEIDSQQDSTESLDKAGSSDVKGKAEEIPDLTIMNRPPTSNDFRPNEEEHPAVQTCSIGDSANNWKDEETSSARNDFLTGVENFTTETAKGADSSSTACSQRSPVEMTEPLVVPHSGLIPISGPIISSSHSIPYSGSLSLRSDSSTNSTRSFAFPILTTDWTGSPVKMPPPDRSHLLHRRPSWRSLCCFCYKKPSTYQ